MITYMKKGNLKTNGIHLQDHEYATVKLFLKEGFDIELIPPVRIKDVRTPDFTMGGISWEMKSPEGGSKSTIRHTIKHAVTQSSNLIIDLRRCRIDDNLAIKELEQHFKLSKRIRRMKIVTKNLIILDFSK